MCWKQTKGFNLVSFCCNLLFSISTFQCMCITARIPVADMRCQILFEENFFCENVTIPVPASPYSLPLQCAQPTFGTGFDNGWLKSNLLIGNKKQLMLKSAVYYFLINICSCGKESFTDDRTKMTKTDEKPLRGISLFKETAVTQ